MLLKDKKSKKFSGILLSITSLPSKYGIGSLGYEAYRFIDFLKTCKQTYWQLLPLCPIGKGNSPYSSVSTFAGEILLIDIEMLIDWGLLSQSDISELEFKKNVDYNAVRKYKLPLLKKAAENFNTNDKEYIDFENTNSYWLEDFALYMSIKENNFSEAFNFWDDALKFRLPEETEYFKLNHIEDIYFYKITQFLFFKQYSMLKAYANKKGIKIIGDIPFYVSLDSADVWSNPDCFKLGRDMTPVLVAGVPPDIFSKSGQLWGNPIYDWDFQKTNGYDWWKKRLMHCANLYDVIRIDHFRAFADYYTIPFGAPDAKSGKWEKGVGMHFWKAVMPVVKGVKIIAEDLGGDTPEVKKLLKDTGFPNMKILQFAFDSDLKNQFLPKNFDSNCFCYTGTHDNDTSYGWFKKATPKERLLFSRIVPRDISNSPTLSLISFGMKSKAKTVIIPMQDYLELDSDSRMNIPGKPDHNWQWRMSESYFTTELCDKILRLSKGRNRR